MSALGCDPCALRSVIVPPAAVRAALQPAAAVVARLANGQGPAGAALATYRHGQPVPAATWTINHNLGRDVSVALYTPGGVEFDAELVQTSLNQCVVLLAAPAAGYARVI